MIEQIDDPNLCKNYEWMYFLKIPPKMKNNNSTYKNIVNERLKDGGIGYTLKRVGEANIDSEGFKNHLLSRKTKGRFVIGLESDGGFVSHAIAIDTTRDRLIFDCMEKYIWKFTNKTLDHCVGQDQVTVQKIPRCYELISLPPKQPNEQKKKNRRKKNSNKCKADQISKV